MARNPGRHKINQKKNCFAKYLIVIVMMAFVTALPVSGSSRKRIAILDFSAENTSQSYANAVRNLFEAALFKENVVDILERNQMETILKEQGFSLSGCTDASCAVQIGKLLSADMVVTGSLNRLGHYIVNAKFVSVTSSSIHFIETIEASSEGDLKDQVYVMARKASRKMNGDRNGARSPMFDIDLNFGNINGGLYAGGFYAYPLGVTDSFIDPSAGITMLGEIEVKSTNTIRMLGIIGGSYVSQGNGESTTDVRKITLGIGWVGLAIRVGLPWSFAMQMNLLGGYSHTSRVSSAETVASSDPALMGELELRYIVFGPYFLSLRGGYLRVLYTGEDLSEMLYGCGVGFFL
jgi:hypothetical protein